MKRKWLFVAAGVILLLGALLYWRTSAVAVTLAEARKGEAVDLVYATGFVEPVQPVAVSARITAPVMRVLVEEGSRVSVGQPLIQLDDADQRATAAQAQAQAAGASLNEARVLKLYRRGWVTRAARDEAVANGTAARAAAAAAGAKAGQNIVRAGIEGIVIKRDIEPGELATPTRVLMQLGNPARTRITATVDERDIPRVRVGQEALLSSDAWPGRVIQARVTELTPTGDPTQRAFRVRLVADAGAALTLGMTLEVNIITRRIKEAVLVPATAVKDDAIWVVEDDKAYRRSVKIGIKGTQQVQIVSGVESGAQIVDKPGDNLREGVRVKPARK